MNPVVRFIAWGGVIAGGGLCAGAFVTSIMAIQQILGPGNGGPLATFLPIFLALIILAFNATSAWMFKLFMTERFTTFASGCTVCMWIGCLVYDFISNVMGLLSTYAQMNVTTWETAQAAMDKLGPVASFFILLISGLLSLGPFITALFCQLAMSDSKSPDPKAMKIG